MGTSDDWSSHSRSPSGWYRLGWYRYERGRDGKLCIFCFGFSLEGVLRSLPALVSLVSLISFVPLSSLFLVFKPILCGSATTVLCGYGLGGRNLHDLRCCRRRQQRVGRHQRPSGQLEKHRHERCGYETRGSRRRGLHPHELGEFSLLVL